MGIFPMRHLRRQKSELEMVEELVLSVKKN